MKRKGMLGKEREQIRRKGKRSNIKRKEKGKKGWRRKGT